jgi:hypothetical protein
VYVMVFFVYCVDRIRCVLFIDIARGCRSTPWRGVAVRFQKLNLKLETARERETDFETVYEN